MLPKVYLGKMEAGWRLCGDEKWLPPEVELGVKVDHLSVFAHRHYAFGRTTHSDH